MLIPARCDKVRMLTANSTKTSLLLEYDDTCAGNVGGSSFMTFNSSSYNLLSISFHSPSEHTIDGKTFAAEINFNHYDPVDKRSLVTSVLVSADATSDHKGLHKLFQEVQFKDQVYTGGVNPYKSLLPSNTDAYVYLGSMST